MCIRDRYQRRVRENKTKQNNMAEQQQQPQGDPILSQDRVNQLTDIFKKYDPEQKASVEGGKLGNVLNDSGLGVSPKVVYNLITYFTGTDPSQPVNYYGFLEIAAFLTEAQKAFQTASGGSGAIANDNAATAWKALGYEFKHPRTYKLLAIASDRDNKGSFNYDGFVSGLLFFRFALQHFEAADKGNKGHLSYEEVKAKLPWLGVDNASDDLAHKLFSAADTDKSGGIDPEEFAAMVVSLKFSDRAAQVH
eukprot:TRINITY_DN449_c0_g1_i2.p1 TRINITY_DN449_c0_g1~~TRINITY_DN449_c0_g1_i2.p1  ORF type:complete len:250 (-),score=75.96 TRINITY_DN449_c0_g1_i2:76-825(-)